MIVTYHNIAAEAGFNTVAERTLSAQLHKLRDTYSVRPFAHYARNLLDTGNSSGTATVTFDDAYESFAGVVIPMLERLDLPALVFVPVDHLGGDNAWDCDITDTVIPVMDRERIAEIADHPLVTIGSHGCSHHRLSRMSTREVAREVLTSKRTLESICGTAIDWFSYPYGQIEDYDTRTVEEIRTAGYLGGCTNRFGHRNNRDNLFELLRIPVDPEDTERSFCRKCSWPLHRNLIRRHIREYLVRRHMWGDTVH